MSRFLSGFALVMLGVLPLAFCATDPQSTGSEPRSSSVPMEPISGIDTAIQKAQEEVRDPFAITAETKAAVTAAPVSAGPAAPVVAVVLEGIGFGSKDAYALIGGDVYYVGDEMNGIKLVEVRRREVDVLVNGGLITVPLFPKEELQKVKDRADKKVASKNVPEGASGGEPSSLVAPAEEQPLQVPMPLPTLEGDELPT